MTSALPMLRGVKDADELERLTAAGAAADACFEELLEVRFAGRTENEVAADLAALLIAHGHSQVDFTVVGSGPNGANPHHEADDRTIEEGDMIVLDFGGLKDGYGSDTSRTIHVGEPTDEEREVHDIVRRAQQAGFEAVRPGATCQDIDRAARAVITDAGYGEQFIHRTGHGIGLTTHEPPYMVEGETHPLEPGMCFSIEPGDLPQRALRRPDRGHRDRDRGRRPTPEQHHARDADRSLTPAGADDLHAFVLELGRQLSLAGTAVSETQERLARVVASSGGRDARVIVLPTALMIAFGRAGWATIESTPQLAGTMRLDQISALYEVVHEAERGAVEPEDGLRRLRAISADAAPARSRRHRARLRGDDRRALPRPRAEAPRRSPRCSERWSGRSCW